MRKPAQVSLKVFSEFKASHSLEGFETPHFHVFKCTLEFKSALPLKTDRVIDIIHAQELTDQILAPLQGRFLNDALGASPTSENLAMYLWNEFLKRHPSAPLAAVEVALCDLAGNASGLARIEG